MKLIRKTIGKGIFVHKFERTHEVEGKAVIKLLTNTQHPTNSDLAIVNKWCAKRGFTL